MKLELMRWIIRTGLQWICGGLLAFAITVAQQHWKQPATLASVTVASVTHANPAAR